MHVADFYATYCGLAGGSPAFCTSDAPANASGLPPIDSLDMCADSLGGRICSHDPPAALHLQHPPPPPRWPLLSGATSVSPRTEVAVDIVGNHLALVRGDYKLITGNQVGAGWCGGTYPNASSVGPAVNPYDQHLACGTSGCLFDVASDPTEQHDVASAHPDIVASMMARLVELAPSYYSNDEVGVDVAACDAKPAGMPCGCYLALPGNLWNGNFGPYQV